MYKYNLKYKDKHGNLVSMVIKASRVEVLKDRIVFFDEHGEDEHVFNRKDVVVYYTIV